MAKIRGVPVFPTHVEFILSEFPELTGRCQIIADKRTPKQDATLKVETREVLSQASQKSLREAVVNEIKNRIGITFNELIFVSPGTFEDKFKKTIFAT
jgi:phenylacetate-coenzyme A ligase PaaK-like adenylate-forming protein